MNERECVCVHKNRWSDCEDTERVMGAVKSRRKRETEGERENGRGIKKTTEEEGEARRLCG